MATPLWTRSLVLLAVYVLPCAAGMVPGRPGSGLVGYGIPMYNPVCPYACRGALSASRLNCSMVMDSDGMSMTSTSTACYATNIDFLTSMAWCIRPRCTEMKLWEIENWWYRYIPGKLAVQPDPMWTYQETLARSPTPPTTAIAHGDPLNTTVLVTNDHYRLQATSLASFTEVEVNHSKYGLVLLTSSVVIPVAASLLRFVPIPGILSARIYARFVDKTFIPPHRGGLHRYLSSSVTRGQAIFMLYLFVVNVVLCVVGYPLVSPHAWWTSRTHQILVYVSNRIGVLSFANVPVFILYAGRNSLLLWLTNWDPSTFMLLHRFVASISTIQAILHSLIYLRIYVHQGNHNSEAQMPYWYWGIIATIGFSILLPLSMSAIRKRIYEVFLATHFALALLSLVACYYHIIYKYDHEWGYEVWIYIAFAVWGFDRLMRLLRMVRYGVRSAVITVIDSDYLRVDVAGLSGHGHAYLYFPTLTWRVWENHPFSVSTTFAGSPRRSSSDQASEWKDVKADAENTLDEEINKAGNVNISVTNKESLRGASAASLTFFIRVRHGVTSRLQKHSKLPVLVESGYAPPYAVPPGSTLVCIAAGVGITPMIPALQAHRGRSKLYWHCRSQKLVDAVEPLLESSEKEVIVGGRCDYESALKAEVSDGVGEVVVVASGPTSMMKDVREVVSLIAETSPRSMRLHCEFFSL